MRNQPEAAVGKWQVDRRMSAAVRLADGDRHFEDLPPVVPVSARLGVTVERVDHRLHSCVLPIAGALPSLLVDRAKVSMDAPFIREDAGGLSCVGERRTRLGRVVDVHSHEHVVARKPSALAENLEPVACSVSPMNERLHAVDEADVPGAALVVLAPWVGRDPSGDPIDVCVTREQANQPEYLTPAAR